MTTTLPPLRVYDVSAATTAVFGRVRGAVRQHQLTIDGPRHNGAPGEYPTPGELLLTAAAACGAEVLQVLARDAGVALERVAVAVRGSIDAAMQPRADVTVFTEVELWFRMQGPTAEQAAMLVAGFQRRCPVYGSLAVASGRTTVHVETEPAGLPPAK